MPATRRETRVCATRPTSRRLKKSSPSCAPPADGMHGRRLRGLIVTMWRAGLRIQEALALTESDLDQRRGSLLVRRGKGGRRREVGGWSVLPSQHAVGARRARDAAAMRKRNQRQGRLQRARSSPLAHYPSEDRDEDNREYRAAAPQEN